MSDASTQHASLAARASDAEREQAVTLLQRGFADGRLTRAELKERVSAALAAQTIAQLRDLTTDLPGAQEQPFPSGMVLDQRRALARKASLVAPTGENPSLRGRRRPASGYLR
jgi:hypothetical protein